MRLFLQAQTPEKQSAVMQAFDELGMSDKQVLVDEMARSGICATAATLSTLLNGLLCGLWF